MKFLLDMGLARTTAVFLRDHGYDAVHLRDEGLQCLSDDRIIEKARQENRIILTHDLDFGRIVALSKQKTPSIITFRLDNMQPAYVNHYLSQALTRFHEELENGVLISIHEDIFRARPLPILEITK